MDLFIVLLKILVIKIPLINPIVVLKFDLIILKFIFVMLIFLIYFFPYPNSVINFKVLIIKVYF